MGPVPTWSATAPGTNAASFSSPNRRTRAAGWNAGCARRSTISTPDERIARFTGATTADRREELKRALQRRSRRRAAAHPDLHRCRARGHQPPDRVATTSSISICRGTRRGSSSATAASTASSSRRPRSAAATSSTSSARKTSCSRRWCARPSASATQLGSAGQVIASALARPARAARASCGRSRSRAAVEAETRMTSAAGRARRDGRRRHAAPPRALSEGPRRSARSAGASRERVGVDPDELRAVVGVPRWPRGRAARRRPRRRGRGTTLFQLDPADPAFLATRLARGAGRSADPAAQSARTCGRLAGDAPPSAPSRSSRRSLPDGADARGRRAAPSGAPAGPAPALALSEPRLPVRPRTRLRRDRARARSRASCCSAGSRCTAREPRGCTRRLCP